MHCSLQLQPPIRYVSIPGPDKPKQLEVARVHASLGIHSPARLPAVEKTPCSGNFLHMQSNCLPAFFVAIPFRTIPSAFTQSFCSRGRSIRSGRKARIDQIIISTLTYTTKKNESKTLLSLHLTRLHPLPPPSPVRLRSARCLLRWSHTHPPIQ
jgi:hypothetical protein